MKEEIYDQFELYNSGEMSASQKLSFEALLESDQSVALEYKAYKLAEQAVEEDIAADLREKFKAWENEGKAESKTTKTTKISIIKRLTTYAAAVMVAGLVFGGFMTWSSQNNVDSLIDNQLFIAHTSQSRSDEGASTDKDEVMLEKADQLFSKKEYNKAIVIYRAIQLDGEMSKFNSAAEFREVLAIYKAEGHTEGFEKLLEQILKNEDHPYHLKAQDLQKSCTNFWYRLGN